MSLNGRKPADSTLMLCLAGGLPVQVAAQTASVSRATAYRRTLDPEFRSNLAALRR
jgi:hypothetical protein